MKKVGDKVERDEPIFEISTDKVDAEIPSPAAGVLQEIRVEAGATVPINTVVAVIAAEGAAVAAAAPTAAPSAPSAPPLAATTAAAPAPPPTAPPPTAPPPTAPAAPAAPPPPVTSAPPPPPVDYVLEGEASVAATMPVARPRADMTAEELRHTRSSPVVRKIAAEHNVDISGIPGTGISGRVTKQDILEHLEAKSAPAPTVSVTPVAAPAPATPAASIPPAPPPRAAAAPPPPSSPAAPAPATVASKPAVAPGTRVEVVPMSPIRRKTAEHMIASQRTSAHVATVFEIDMTRIDHLRHKHRAAYEERSGIKLTYMPFILKATVDALKAWPVLNASIDGDSIVYRKDINLGIAVALDWGLIVPVIHNADEKNLLGLARGVSDLAERARAKKLKVDEVQGGTFTITNPGVFGSLFGTPIINQPQVAILGVGTIEKRPVVRDDAIAIRTMAYFALSFDHRLVDGSDADRFMAHLKKGLQEFDESGL
jgi:2-oxoglutarate dehydrogenase E2 component (dihydrolipoamide succinyltransferase)